MQSSDNLKNLLELERVAKEQLQTSLTEAEEAKVELLSVQEELARQEFSMDGLIAEIAELQAAGAAAEKEKVLMKSELDGAMMRLDEAGLLG